MGRSALIAAVIVVVAVVGQLFELYRVNPFVMFVVTVPLVLAVTYVVDSADRFGDAPWPPPAPAERDAELAADRRVRELQSMLDASREGNAEAHAALGRLLVADATQALVRRGADPEQPFASLEAAVPGPVATYLRASAAGEAPVLSRRRLHDVLRAIAEVEAP